jgi:hypothetical protein
LEESVCKAFVGVDEGERQLKKRRRRRKYTIKMYLKGIELEGVDSSHLASDRKNWWNVMNTVMNIWVP